MIDWSRAYTCQIRLYEVNEKTWENSNQVPGSYDISISTDGTDTTPLLHTAQFTVDRSRVPGLSYNIEGWYRVEARIAQDGYSEIYPLTTQLVEIDQENLSLDRVELSFSGKSVLQPVADRQLRIGEFVPKEYNGAEWAAAKLRECTPAPVRIDGRGFELEDYYVFSAGETYLSAIWDILGYGDWCIQLDGNGIIYLRPKPTEAKMKIYKDLHRVLDQTASKSISWAGVPNRYIARYNGEEYSAENHNSRSPISYERRGRWVDVVEENPTLLAGETIEYYVKRKLEEASTMLKTYTYKREFIGDIQPYDLLDFSTPFMNGTYRVLSQTLTIGKGISVSEKVGEAVKEYEIDV